MGSDGAEDCRDGPKRGRDEFWDRRVLRLLGFAFAGICSRRDLGPPGVQVAECFPLAGGGWEAKNRIFPVGTEGFYDMGVGFEK